MAEKKETIVAAATRISGEVRGDEDLVVRGRVDGKIQLSQTLTVEAGGIVQADVDVKAAVVSGVILGNVTASESIHLTDKARVVGDLSSPRIVVDAGAAFRGRVDMGGETAARAGHKRQAAERGAPASVNGTHTTVARTPPKMAPTPRHGISVGALAPRVASAPPSRTVAPPSMLRPQNVVASASSSPAWAKKKLRRR